MSTPDAIELALYARMQNDPQLTELVGSRIYPVRAPQSLDPLTATHIVYRRTSTDPRPHAGGGGDFSVCNIEVRAKAPPGEYAAVKELGERLRLLLHGWTDRDSNVSACMLERYTDLNLTPADGSDQAPEVAVLDFRLQYTQAIT